MGAGDYLAACACGLQNAMVSTYSGAMVRTTHVSGIVTDLGIALGHLLRGLPTEGRKVELWLLLLGGFIGGGVLGARLFQRQAYDALYLPAALTGFAGLVYTGFVHIRRSRSRRPTQSAR
jgi:uncharacterized membrane protein YoaK (UPF0700 family)